MTYLEAYLAEFDRETATTRRFLERVPEAKADWKPHAKSMALGQLAKHVATLPGYATKVLAKDSLDVLDAANRPPAVPATREAWLAAFDRAVADARAAIVAAKDEDMAKTWTLRAGPQEILALPRAQALRGFALNHLIHHRAQLGVYLRLNDVPVPRTYGPSADEGVPGLG